MKKIILLCAAGMSTSLLLKKMKEYAAEINFECEIKAYSINAAEEYAKNADYILLGPQVRFELEEIKRKCPGIPVEAVDMMDYGMMNGKKVINSIINKLERENK